MSETTDAPLVSVAIITYNQLDFLKECVASVIAQDYPNIEIVVADDGSTDGTREFLLQCEKEHARPFILRLNPANHGITANSNAAHFACSGKYIAWMGGDDLMLQGKISQQVEFLEARPDHAICHHELEIFDSVTGNRIVRRRKGNVPRNGDIETMVRHGTINGASSTMVRASSTPASGFDIRTPIVSDWMYWIDTLSGGGKIGYLDQVLGRYRRHGNNVTTIRDSVARIENIQDDLIACILVVSKYPWLASSALYRCAHLLLEIRFLDLGRHYRDYLKASLKVHLTAKGLAGLLLERIFRYRR
ncbi:MAG TPA: glycosyltransferase [Caulobacteraceae bacterium]